MRLVANDFGATFTAISQSLLTDQRKRRIIEFLASDPERRSTINQIAMRIGEDFGFVKRVLENLERIGVLRLVKIDNRYHIERTNGLTEMLTGRVSAWPGSPD